MGDFNLWRLVGSLGVFLCGLYFIESSLESLSGRKLRLLIREGTKSKLRGILSGTLATSVLQSSSLVSLMVVAFVGTGLMALSEAVGVIIGANFGTTVTGWIIAILGFKLNVINFAYGCLGVGGLLVLVLEKKTRWHEMAKLVLGLGLLVAGLQLMKESTETLKYVFDFAGVGSNRFSYFVFGLLLTAVIQSSSATLALTLSALNAGVVSFDGAVAIVIGANLGTTITIFFGAVGKSSDKKRVALVHFFYNFVVAIVALIFMNQMIGVVRLLGFEGDLYSLVAFHTLFNLLGIFLFFPFIDLFAKFLKKLFRREKKPLAVYLTDKGQTSLHAMEAQVADLMNKVLNFNRHTLVVSDYFALGAKMGKKSFAENYRIIKGIEGELLEFRVGIDDEGMSEDEKKKLGSLIDGARNLVYSSKEIKDIAHDLKNFSNSGEDILYDFYGELGEKVVPWYKEIKKYFKKEGVVDMETLLDFKDSNQKIYDSLVKEIHGIIKKKKLKEDDVATLFNVLVGINQSNNMILRALESYLKYPAEEA
jgi:phosphate:Na+ symporter